jgi:hypothetical protein
LKGQGVFMNQNVTNPNKKIHFEIDSEGMGLDYFGAQEMFYQSYQEKLERKKRRSA